MAAPFDYEDLLEDHIKSLEALNNKHDPTGKLNELRIPPMRKRQRASRPLFYEPSQHSSSPQLSVAIDAPTTMSLDAPYPVSITLCHHINPSGNPQKRPVTLAWKDTALNEILDTEIAPWLFLHHANGKLKELDDGNNGPGLVSTGNESEEQLDLSETNGFISLNVGECRNFKVNFTYTGDGLQLKAGEKYSIAFRGSRIHWWQWGSLDDLSGPRKVNSESVSVVATLPASNLIDVSVSSTS